VRHESDKTAGRAGWFWVVPLLALVLPPALLLLVSALNYAGLTPEGLGMRAWNVFIITPVACIVASGLIFIAATAL
jgi:hypothetical protein